MSISRRDFLATTAALATTGISLPKPKSFEFLYFSDTHVAFDRNVEACRKMMLEMSWRTTPAFAINGGDVTDYGWAGEYDNYQALIKEFKVPTLDTAGNHDVRWSPQGVKIFKERLGEPYSFRMHEGVAIIVLDSTVPLSHWGHYSRPQLTWLKAKLHEIGKETPIVITTHHWTGRDRVMIDNEDELRLILRPYNVKLILTGHGHSDLLWDWDHMVCTQNRGLYQGSWQRIQVDREANEIRLARWTQEKRVFDDLVKVSLDPAPAPQDRKSLVLTGKNWSWLKEGTMYRPGEGEWQPEKPTATETLPGKTVLQTLQNGVWTTTIEEAEPTGSIQEVWESPLPGGVMSHLVADQSHLYVTSMDGSVSKITKEDGKKEWSAQTQGYCHSSPLVTDDLVIHGSADARLYAWDKQTGKPKWTVKTDGPVYGGSVLAQGVIVFGSGDGRFYGIDPATGKTLWSTPMPESNTAYVQSVPCTDGERVYLTGWDSHIYAVDPQSGEIVWRKPCQPRTFAFSPAIGSPCVAEGKVYCIANGNGLFRFDAKTGEQEYEVEAPGDKYGHSSPVFYQGDIYVGGLGDNGSVWRTNAETGQVVHEWRTGKTIYDSSPSIGNGFLAIGSVASQLNLCALNDPTKIQKYKMPHGHFLSTPLADRNEVYAASFGEKLIKLRVNNQ